MDSPTDIGSSGVEPGTAPRAAPGASPGPPEGSSPGPRRLRRRPDEGHIAGVCAGIAEYFNVDPLIVRIAAVVLLLSGPGFFAYVLAWIFVPAEPGRSRYDEPQPPIDRRDRATQIFGIVLLALGVSVIWGDWWAPARGWLFPLGLMALGAWLLLRPDRDDDELPPATPAPPVVPAPTAPAWSGTDATVTAPLAPHGSDETDGGTDGAPEGTAELAGDAAAPPDPTDVLGTAPDAASATGAGGVPEPSAGDAGPGAPRAPWDVPPPPGGGPPPPQGVEGHDAGHPRRRHRHRHLVAPTVFGVLLMWAGIAWLTDVGLSTGLAVGLVILGLGFVLGSFVGGSRALIVPALIVAIALAITAIIDIPLHGPVGQHTWSPDSVEELAPEYEVSMGEGIVDLSELGILRSEETVRASVGFGHLVVLVPDDQAVHVDTEVGAGESIVFGEQQDGLGVESHESYDGRGATLVLDLEAGMGQIEVRRAEASRARSLG